MSFRRLAPSLSCMLLLALAWPATSAANHVSISAEVQARLIERTGGSWRVEVSWQINCAGAASPGYSGNLYLVEVGTGATTYLGGVASATGSARQLVAIRQRDRFVQPRLEVNCFDTGSMPHGSNRITVEGTPLLIPGSGSLGSGGSGGGGGGGGGGGSGGAPADPLRSGGCATPLIGTNGDDRLGGTGGGDLILGLRGRDRIRGGPGHDCLVGGSGRDRLVGGSGWDRLTGGPNGDRLDGGSGRNFYDAGSGNDYVNARNRRRERVLCGRGRDRARVDRNDRVRNCERVQRPR